MSEFTFKIPKSTLMVKAKMGRDNNWTLTAINTNSFIEKKIKEKLTGDQAAAFSVFLITCGKTRGFFGKNHLSVLKTVKHYIKLIKDKNICLENITTLMSERSTSDTSSLKQPTNKKQCEKSNKETITPLSQSSGIACN